MSRLFLRCSASTAVAALLVLPASAFAQKKGSTAPQTEESAEKRGQRPGSYYASQPGGETVDITMYERIRAEGLNHGKVMQFAGGLMDNIGPRLTGSPNMRKANEYTRDIMTAYGLSNAHLEDWGEFGMGWQQVKTWARMVAPDTAPRWSQAAPWAPATNGPVMGDVVYLPLADASELEAVKGKLAGKIVLLGAMRPTPDITESWFDRYTEEELRAMEGPEAPRAGPAPAPVRVGPRETAGSRRPWTRPGRAPCPPPARTGSPR